MNIKSDGGRSRGGGQKGNQGNLQRGGGGHTVVTLQTLL